MYMTALGDRVVSMSPQSPAHALPVTTVMMAPSVIVTQTELVTAFDDGQRPPLHLPGPREP